MRASLLLLPVLLSGCVTSRFEPRATADASSALARKLRHDVTVLSEKIGERNCYRPRPLVKTAAWIESELRESGYKVRRESFRIDGARFHCADQTVCNLIAELPGTPHSEEIVIVGAHYDSRAGFDHWHDHAPVRPELPGTPGANDNGSGVAATLALARQFAGHPQERTLRFCFWVNEEPPFYQTRDADAMGSLVSARRSHEAGEKIAAVVAFDTIGCYSPQPRTKRSKIPTAVLDLVGLPDRSDYVTFVTTHPNGDLAGRSAKAFSGGSAMPARMLALPYLGKKVAWSDDWSYTRFGYPAFCVTDTAFLRADHYHERDDLPRHLDYKSFAEVVRGMHPVLVDLAGT